MLVVGHFAKGELRWLMHLTYIRYILNQITVVSIALQSQSPCCVDSGDKYGLLHLNFFAKATSDIYI